HIDILGDRSARIVEKHASSLRNVTEMRIIALGRGARGNVSVAQIRAASVLGPLESLEIYGSFDANTGVSHLCGLMRIGFLLIAQYNALPSELVEQLGSRKADRLRILCLDHSSQFPADALASFQRSSCTQLEIWGGIDDRGFEMLASAPNLVRLEINNLG